MVSIMTIIFEKSSPKIGIFGPKSENFYFFYKNLEQDKFEGADFKYDKGVFKMLVQEYLNKSILVPNLSIFFVLQTYAIRQIRESSFQI